MPGRNAIRRSLSLRAVVRLGARRLALLPLVLGAAAAPRAQDWPAFRGPPGDGRAMSAKAPIRWDAGSNVRWKVKLPRPANGSPIVVGDSVLLTVAEDRDGRERSLCCFDRASGSKRWVRTVSLDKTMPTHRRNPYGGSTPVSDGQRVVVWHASAGLRCYDLAGPIACIDVRTGERMWSQSAAPGQIWGSIVHAAGHLYVMNQRGTTIVFKPDPKKLRIVARNPLGERTSSTPAVAGDAIFLRTHAHLWCIAEPRGP